MYLRTRTNWTKHIDFMLLDILCIIASYILAFSFRFHFQSTLLDSEYLLFLCLVVLVEVATSLMTSNLADVLKRGPFAELVHMGVLSSLSLMATTLFMFALHDSGFFSRLLVFYTFILFTILGWLVRLLYKRIVIANLKQKAASGEGSRAAFILVEKNLADKLINDLKEDFYEPFLIKGIVFSDQSVKDSYQGIPCYETIKEASKVICREWIDEVFVSVNLRTPDVSQFINNCKEMGVTVHVVLDVKDAEKSKQFIETLGGNTVITTAYNYVTPHQSFVKRVADIIGGLIGSLFALLIGIIIGPIIYFSSPGPILFKQTRIGRNGKPFQMLKFRSMYPDADERKKEFMAQNRVADGRMFKLNFDPRIIGNKVLPDGTHKTGIGEFIRKTSLDEFPQFFNVLKGDMSLVGTRPPTIDEWEKYEFHHRARLAVRPGITGMWQVSGRSKITDFEEIVRLDTEYISNFRISLDIKILLKTLFVVFQRKGAM